MYEYIKGNITELTPAFAVVESAGVGYYINISLNTYSQLHGQKESQLMLHQIVREDAHILYGFANNSEREIFRLLISVSGVGANTARMILSSMSPAEVQVSISQGQVEALKKIKGIGAKSAQRIIVDLKDKMKVEHSEDQFLIPQGNTIKNEALSALEILGFAKKQAEKTIDKLLVKDPSIGLEELIKQALNLL